MEDPPSLLNMDDSMTHVMDRFQKTKAEELPVVDASGKFVGLIDQVRLYSAYRQMLVDFSEE
jgi:CIC family chloride channel protein